MATKCSFSIRASNIACGVPATEVNFDQIVEKVDFRRSSSIFVYAEVQLNRIREAIHCGRRMRDLKACLGMSEQCGICICRAKEVLEQALMQKALAQCYAT
jgi:bacterioferritin-associated ferredoxin